MKISAPSSSTPLDPSTIPTFGLAGVKGLSITTANSPATVSVTFSQAVLTNSIGNVKFFAGTTLTAALLTSGANGLDTGSPATATFYSVWLISNGTNLAVLLSLSATAPTMPSGYTYKVRIGWVCTDLATSPNRFFLTKQQDRTVIFIGDSVDSNWLNSSTSKGTISVSNVWTQYTFLVPSTAKSVLGFVAAISSVTAIIGLLYGLDPTSNFMVPIFTYAATPNQPQIPFELPISNRQSYLKSYTNGAAVPTITISVYGWEDNL